MKNLLQKMALAISCLLIMSCDKEQVLVNKIEGTYKIEKLVFLTSKGDSVVNLPNSTMFFDDCKLKDQTAQQCSGYYEIAGQNRMSFEYLPRKEERKEVMNINSFDFDANPYFGGSYIIDDLTDNGLILFRQRSFNTNEPDLRIFLKK